MNIKNDIPKIIHYFWFGNKPKPQLILDCIESWRRFFPDWEIKEWNEHNYDINKCDYIREAYNLKKWAFVSDYARCDILYQYGGVYFDTDVEVLKEFPDYLWKTIAFCGVESTGTVNPGLVFCCPPKFWLMGDMLDSYNKSHFTFDRDINKVITINKRVTEILIEKGYKIKDSYQCIEGLAIYPCEYFCAFDQMIREPNITNNTITYHHYASSWSNHKFKNYVINISKKYLGIEKYRRILFLKRKFRNK